MLIGDTQRTQTTIYSMVLRVDKHFLEAMDASHLIEISIHWSTQSLLTFSHLVDWVEKKLPLIQKEKDAENVENSLREDLAAKDHEYKTADQKHQDEMNKQNQEHKKTL